MQKHVIIKYYVRKVLLNEKSISIALPVRESNQPYCGIFISL